MAASRPAFPVVESTLASDALAPLVQYCYELAAPVTCTFIKRGTNDTYLVTSAAGEKAILRAYPHGRRTREQIEEELEILDLLHSKHAPVSYAVRSRNGERMQTVTAPEAERHLVLFKYAEGDFGPFDDAHLVSLGKSLAQIHAASNDISPFLHRPSLDVPNLVHQSTARINLPPSPHWGEGGGGGQATLANQPALDSESNQPLSPSLSPVGRGSQVAMIERAMALIERATASLPRTTPEFGFCHGDFVGFNTHVDADGHQCHFDFDFCGFGWRAYDLAVFLWSRQKIVGPNLAPQHWARFLEGYESQRKITDAERRAIPYFVLCREISIMGVALESLNRFPRRPSEDPVAGCAQFVKRWIDEQHLDR